MMATVAATGEGTTAGAGPSVTFATDRRPEVGTRVTLEAFDGPLALLLALIEARQLDVLTVPLGPLADAYLDALAALDQDRLGNIASFVAVASQLILIKSRAMLPRREDAPAVPLDDAPDPEAELRARLLLYRAYRDGGVVLAANAVERIGLFRREPATAQAAAIAGARPGALEALDPHVLARALTGLVRLAPVPAMPSEVVPRTITIGDRAAVIRAALAGAPAIVLQELLRGVRDRVVVAVTFLAMLELMKRREIVVEQAEPWGPILARRTTPAERGDGPPADEPIDETLESFA
ncbi:MAG TPA: segregation/condensation protein A [Candidatus Limnocylindrales bacterium]